jgi:hypothetical protein
MRRAIQYLWDALQGRSMRKQALWTPEEDGRATEWRAAGLTWSEIAVRLGRSQSAVRNRFRRTRDAPPKQIPKQSAAPAKQVEKVPAHVLADRDARAQARFDAQEADPLSLFFGDPVRPPIRRNG